jgi:hypothetical protein
MPDGMRRIYGNNDLHFITFCCYITGVRICSAPEAEHAS